MAVRDRLDAVVARQRPFSPPDPASEAVKTWRYLRLAMVALVAGLAASVVYEHFRTATSCWQLSISAYYYTPVQGFLVGALVTVGVSLVAIKGSTDWEDLLLNLAGVSAPVVAFVPYRDPGTCGSVLTTPVHRDLNIANNVTGLLVAGGLGLLVVAVLALRGRWNPGAEPLTPTARFGFAVTVALYLGTVVVFLVGRRWFVDWGHPVAAIAMFGFIVLNVGLNALNWRRQPADRSRTPWRTNWYAVVALLMVLAAVGWALVGLVGHWRYWLLGIESSLIALFAAFWVLQTVELWDRGLRPAPGAQPDEGAAARPVGRHSAA